MVPMKYIIGNWKSHKTSSEIQAWVEIWKLNKKSVQREDLQVVICAPLTGLPVLHELVPDLRIGSQVLSPFGDGAYTGAVSARLVKEYAQFALLGHVERRTYFGETDLIVAQQVAQAIDNNLVPVVAVADKNWGSQLAQLDREQLAKTLVMYEPPEAISTSGSGHAADIQQVKEAVALIQSEYKVKGVLYGGSVNADNIADYMNEPTIAGVVPGAASLDAATFIQLILAY